MKVENKISIVIFTLYISSKQISSSANEDSFSRKVHLREDSYKCKYNSMFGVHSLGMDNVISELCHKETT